MNLVKILQDIGCANAANEGAFMIDELRDKRWVELFTKLGYDRGEFITPGDSHAFFIVFPDGNIGSADNIMLANGFYTIAEELGFEAEEVLNAEPYGTVIPYIDEDGDEDENTCITVWTPEEFMHKIEHCKDVSGQGAWWLT